MKVLKLKDKANINKIRVKRGFNEIVPFFDAEGSYVLGLDVLQDGVYKDLYEQILDACELVDYKEPIPSITADTPPIQERGEFSTIVSESRNIEEAVIKYYDSKTGMMTKVLRFLGIK